MPGSAHTDEITRNMFVATADRNYMLARIAHSHALDTDFWWLSLHALEKYLKAILLLNGRSAKNGGHDLVKLTGLVRALDNRIAFGPFTDPAIETLHWRDSSVEDFLVRLNEYGSTQNRYLAYGHTASLDDLVKVDQLVWSVRRHCIPFKVELGDPGHVRVIDRLKQLVHQPDRWQLGGTLPLEKVMARPQSDPLHTSLMQLNTAFNPNGDLVVQSWRVSGSNPPLAPWFDRLASPTKDTRDTAAEVLQWSLDNVYFVKPDQRLIEEALRNAGYGPPAPLPPPAPANSKQAAALPKRLGASARASLARLWRRLRSALTGKA